MFISVFLVDTTYTVATIYLVWFFSVAHYGDPAVLSFPVWPLQIIPVSLAWPAFVTQLYLIRRLWRLVPSKTLVIVSSVLATSSLLLAAMLTVRFFLTNVYVGASFASVSSLMAASLVVLFVTDCFITGSLTIAFLRARTGIIRVDHLIYRFTRGAIQTGLFAGIATLGGLVGFFCARGTSLDLLFGIPMGRVYTATLLYSVLLRVDSQYTRDSVDREHLCTNTRRLQLTSAIPLDETVIVKDDDLGHT